MSENPPDTLAYIKCIHDVRERLNAIELVGRDKPLAGKVAEFFAIDAVFLQFRKCLELIAFSSLTANKDIYSAAHKNFHKYYKAKDILAEVEKHNPKFYPLALTEPKKTGEGTYRFDQVTDGALTREEFERLYDVANDILHARNPFSLKDPTLDVVYPPQIWLEKIRRLLAWHSVQLVNGNAWLIVVPPSGSGPVRVLQGVPSR